MLSAPINTPLRSQELAEVAYLRTYAYASACLLMRKYKAQYTDMKDGSATMKLLAVNIVLELLEKDGMRQSLEGSQIWQAALVAARGGDKDSKDT